jgi:hypothetical protein
MGRLTSAVLIDKLTATRQFSCLPTCPQYCCVTPTECVPFFTNPVSSTIQASIGPCFCMAGSAYWRTASRMSSSLQGAWVTTWCKD